jgi:hypothetical protein
LATVVRDYAAFGGEYYTSTSGAVGEQDGGAGEYGGGQLVEEKVERLTTDMRREQAAIKDQLSLLLRHFEIKTLAEEKATKTADEGEVSDNNTHTLVRNKRVTVCNCV